MKQNSEPLRIVITGAMGFLGRHVATILRTYTECNIILVSRQNYAETVKVNNYSDTPGGDILIHLAEESVASRAEVLGGDYESQSVDTIKALVKKGFSQIIYASSGLLYGDSSNTCHDETSPIYPNGNIYLRIKRSSEEIILDSGGTVVRLSNLYGIGMSDKNVISAILQQVPGNGNLVVQDSAPKRDFLWVEDAARAIAMLAIQRARRVSVGELYNVGTGNGTSIGMLARIILDISGQGGREVISASPSSRESALVLNCNKIRMDVGWSADTTLEDGIRKLTAIRALKS